MAINGTNLLNQLGEIWRRLEASQRFTIILFGVLAAAGIGSMAYFINRVDYEVLYRDLSPEDAQAIVVKLKEQKVDYIVQGSTNPSILVASSKSEIDKLRLEIAGSGLARSGRIGYEIFDKSPFGMTDFTEQVNLQRALEGELARTISSLTEIAQARVHLVLPKDSIFEEQREEAKASVVLGLKKGSALSKSSIAGIRNLVAYAVPGLRPYNVSVVDVEGSLISQGGGAPDGGRGEIESGIREQLEKEMVSKVISILEPLIGKGRVHANASIDLDFNTTEQTEETFNPVPPAIVSQTKTEERLASATTPSGIPGVQANPAAANDQPPGSSPERSRLSEVTNYEINRLTRHTLQPKGAIRRISVAVILDNKLTYDEDGDGNVTTKTQPLSQQELEAYRDLVYAAVGYNQTRGDTVTLENVPFYTEVKPRQELLPIPWYVRWQPFLLPALKYTSFLVLFLLVYLVLFRPVKKRVMESIAQIAPPAPTEQVPQLAEPDAARALPGHEPQEEGLLPEQADQGEVADTQEDEFNLDAIDERIEREFMKEAQMADLGARKYAVLKRKLAEKAHREPEMLSQLIRAWIQER